MSFGYQMLGFGGGGTPVTPIDELLATALARYTADDIVGSFPVTEWTNSGTGGASYDLDTVVGTAANLITLPSHSGRVNTGIFSSPDSATSSITGSIEIIARVSSSSWTTFQNVVVKTIGGNHAYELYIEAGGYLSGQTSVNGTAIVATNSTAAVGFTNGTTHWVRWTWNDSTDVSNYYTAADQEGIPPSWTQLGSADISHVSAGINDNTTSVHIGALTADNWPFLGNVHRAIIYDGIGGTVAVDFNPADASPNTDTWTSSGAGGEVWTIEGDAMVNATDYDAVYAKGSVGLETTAGQAIAQSNTTFLVYKPQDAAPATYQYALDARSDNTKRQLVRNNDASSDRFNTYSGSGSVLTHTSPYTNDLQVHTLQWKGGTDTKYTVSGIGSATGSTGADDWDFASMFMAYDGGTTTKGAVYELIVFDSALSEDDVALVQDYLETKYELANAETLLATALAHFTPADIVGTFPVTEWTNSGTGGAGYDLDTVVGTAANLISLPSKRGYTVAGGGIAEAFSTPDSAANSHESDVTFIWYGSLSDWTPPTSGDSVNLVYSYLSTGNERAFIFGMSQGTSGRLQLVTSASGTSTLVSSISTAATGFTDGTAHWLRMTWNDTSNELDFYTSDDPETTAPASVSWTQLGTTVTHSSAGIFNNAQPLYIGQGGSTDHSMHILTRRCAGINSTDETGALAWDFNAADATANDSTWTSSGAGGETWTINGDAFVNTTDYAAVFSKGSVLIETTDLQIHAAPLTTFIVLKPTLSAPGADAYFYDAGTGATDRNLLFTDESNSDKYTLYAGSWLALSDAYSNDATIISIQHNGDATTKLTVANTGSVTGDAGALDQEMLTLFDKLGGGESWQGAMYEVILFNSALTDSEVGTIRNHLLTKYGL